MKLFFKLAVLLMLLVVLSYGWPLLLIPLGALVFVVRVVGSVFFGGVAAIFGMVCTLGSVLVGLALACGLILAPIAVPVLVLIGICALFRRTRSRSVAAT